MFITGHSGTSEGLKARNVRVDIRNFSCDINVRADFYDFHDILIGPSAAQQQLDGLLDSVFNQPMKNGADGTATVMYRGAQWTARAEGVDSPAPGLWRIVRVEGARLVVEPNKA